MLGGSDEDNLFQTPLPELVEQLDLLKAARLEGATVYCTEMWDPHNLDHAFHYETFDHPEIYDFVDISQNNHKAGQQHWDNCLAQFRRLTQLGNLRPVNNIKVYGSDEAYCRALPGEAYAIYFPDGGEALLEVGSLRDLTLQWLSVLDNRWSESESAHAGDGQATLATPGKGHWICIVTADAAR